MVWLPVQVDIRQRETGRVVVFSPERRCGVSGGCVQVAEACKTNDWFGSHCVSGRSMPNACEADHADQDNEAFSCTMLYCATSSVARCSKSH